MPSALTSILCITWLVQPAFADAELAAYASEARVEVSPRDTGRAIRLPPLDFSVRAEFDCADEAVAESVTISVADTFQRFTPGDGDDSFDAVIRVPRNQIAPIPARNFCMGNSTGDNDGKEELLLTGVATAQVSLRCVTGDTRSVSFSSLSLPLRLVCQAGGDQESSAGVPSPAR